MKKLYILLLTISASISFMQATGHKKQSWNSPKQLSLYIKNHGKTMDNSALAEAEASAHSYLGGICSLTRWYAAGFRMLGVAPLLQYSVPALACKRLQTYGKIKQLQFKKKAFEDKAATFIKWTGITIPCILLCLSPEQRATTYQTTHSLFSAIKNSAKNIASLLASAAQTTKN